VADWRTGLRHREVLHVGIVVAALGLILGAGLAMMGWPAGASGFLVAAGGGVCLASPLVRVLEVRRPDRPGEAVAVVAGLVAVAGLVTHIVVWGMVYVIDRASAAAGGVPLTWRQAGPALAATAGLATLLSLWQAAGRPRTGRVARAAVLGWVGNAALIALVPFGLAMAAVAGGVGAEVTRDAVAREAGPGLSRGGLGIVATLAGVAAVFGGTVALVWFAPSLVFRLALWTLPRDGDPDGPGFWHDLARTRDGGDTAARADALDLARLLRACRGGECARYAHAFFRGETTFAPLPAADVAALREAERTVVMMKLTGPLGVLLVLGLLAASEHKVRLAFRSVVVEGRAQKVPPTGPGYTPGFGHHVYEYEVEGRQYKGAADETEVPRADIERLRPGDPFAVRYVSADPRVSEPADIRGVSRVVGVGLALAFAGAILAGVVGVWVHFTRRVRALTRG